jgi:hypothetical protein
VALDESIQRRLAVDGGPGEGVVCAQNTARGGQAMAGPLNGFLGRTERELAAAVASLIPLAALSGLPVPLICRAARGSKGLQVWVEQVKC